MAKRLSDYLGEVFTDDAKRRELLSDPVKAIKKSGLSETHKKMIAVKDWINLAEDLAAEIRLRQHDDPIHILWPCPQGEWPFETKVLPKTRRARGGGTT